MARATTQVKILVPGSQPMVALLGQGDELLKLVEAAFDSEILVRGNEITITGPQGEAEEVGLLFEELLSLLDRGHVLTPSAVGQTIALIKGDQLRPTEVLGDVLLTSRGKAIAPKTAGQKRYVDAIRRATVTFAIGPAGTGKCIAGESLVLTDLGMVAIGDLARTRVVDCHEPIDLTVHGVDGPEVATHVYNGGESETVRVVTRLGYSIEVTPEHPLLSLDPQGGLVWKRADQLRVGDVVALQRGQRMFGNRTSVAFVYRPRQARGDQSRPVCLDALDPEFAYFLGILVGDGCLTFPNRVILSSGDEEVVAAFHAVARRLGLHVFRNGGDRPYDYILQSSQLYQLLEHLGMSMGPARTKRIPRAILEAPEEVVAAFLRGLFDADGSVDRRDGTITLSSVSGALVRHVQVVLLNFGIVARRGVKRRYLGARHLSFLLSIAGAEADRFQELIGFGLERKGARLRVGARNTNVDVLPHRATLISAAKHSVRLTRAGHKLFGDYGAGRRRPSDPKLGHLVQVLEANGASGQAFETLRDLADRRLLFVPVESLRRSRARVFDLTVPGTHSFVANGFVNHNTYLAVASAVKSLQEREVSRIILTRPAVEAGERLGFLPGTLYEKIDPYMKPLYDALYEMMDADALQRLMERGTVEVAPLAFMRGRAQPYFSQVLTPSGFRPIRSLAVGDLVIGSDGLPTPVLGVYPQGRKEVFRVRTQDGASTLCCAEHLWAVSTPADERRGKPLRVLETREMRGRLPTFHAHRFELPLVSRPVEFQPREVPLDPYALGLLLGDGCLTTSTTPPFSTGDSELALALEMGLEGVEFLRRGGADYVIRRRGGGGRGGVATANPITAILRDLGLAGTRSNSKFVPRPYLYNSPHVRLAVLQGLLDTDGGRVTQRGRSCRIQYVTTSPRLRDDVVFLVRSLGGVAHWRTRAAAKRRPGRAGGREVPHRSDAYIMDIRLPKDIEPFRLTRKRELYRMSGGGRPMRFIVSIEPAGEYETLCIQVAAPDSLYVTDDFLVTHNSLNDSFIILDEAQNTSPEQMKMFLTRLGFGSKSVINGDVTQIDLPPGQRSGLVVVEEILSGIQGLEFIHLGAQDVVRHRIVQDIVEAYRRYGEQRARVAE